MRNFLLTVGLAVVLAAPAAAQSVTPAPGPYVASGRGDVELPPSLRNLAQREPERALRQLAEIVLRAAPDGALSPEALATYESILIARARAAEMQEMLALDLDFDGRVTAEERDAVWSRMDSRSKVSATLAMSGADGDGDGVITLVEMVAAVRQTAELDRRGNGELQQVRDMMVFDFDGDGTLTLQELRRAVYGLKRE